MPAAPKSPFCSRSAVNQSYRHIVDVGARGSCDDRAADGPQGVIGIVLPEDIVHGHSPCGQFPVGGAVHIAPGGICRAIRSVRSFRGRSAAQKGNVAGGWQSPLQKRLQKAVRKFSFMSDKKKKK